MSIPKEPRQLMINLMYLVLTAMLALNVSAEIINAFLLVNQGLETSNQKLDAANDAIPAQITELVKKNPSELQKYADRVPKVRALSEEFNKYIDTVVHYMIDQTGNKNGVHDEYYLDPEFPDDPTKNGDYKEDKGVLKPRGYKNKDITTRYLVGQNPGANEGEGAKVEEKIEFYRKEFLKYIDPADQASFNIPLAVDTSYKNSQDKLNWAHYNFFHMPLVATMPIFNKIKNDVKSTEAGVLGYLLGKVGGEDIVFDKFQVVSAPVKSYIIKGEKYEADIFLSASSSNVKGMSVTVDGSSLPVKDGVAKFSQTASATGVKKYTATISMVNPVTGDRTTEKSTFEYEVGERSVAVSLDKMNVFYIGVDNPVSVSAAGTNSNDLKASGSGITLTKKGAGKYNVTANTPGPASITVSGGGLQPTKFDYKVKRIPDPVAEVGKSSGGQMGNGEFKAQGGVAAMLKNFDFDARCDVVGFELTRQAKRQDPQPAPNKGARFGQAASNLVKMAAPGDVYYFDNVKVKCPGDPAARTINSMVFKIR